MMMTLFSSFDPTTSMKTSLNWMSSLILLIWVPPTLWIIPTRYKMILNKALVMLNNELKTILTLNPISTGASLMFTSLMMMILFNNFMGLFPYIFTSSSHIVFTATLAFPMWLSFWIFGWISNTKYMLAHLVPHSSPYALLPFLVCIETISNLIRPMALALRLAANMISGHLLLTLLGELNISLDITTSMLMMVLQMLLLTLELAVSLIQSYVFTILSTLYFSETY